MAATNRKVRVAIIGVGNCASALVQGVFYYRDRTPNGDRVPGIMHWEIEGLTPGDIQFVAAFDVDARKVGKDLSEAIFSKPNCTTIFCREIPKLDVPVMMGKVLDGVAPHMREYPEDQTFVLAQHKEPSREDIIDILKDSGAEVVVNFLPVGSEQATRFYAECALAAGCAFVNCIPVFIASDREWAKRFAAAGLPIIGDDVKSQVGATIVHRVLTRLFADRGVPLDRTYQLNFGGNTDFLNMLARERLKSKKISKTEAVQSQLDAPLPAYQIHIGPSDYVPWLNDNKICMIRMEGRLFGDVPMYLEVKLSVEDSPNSAGVVIDAIRIAKLALMRGISGPLMGPSAYFKKHPPVQMRDSQARQLVEAFIRGNTALEDALRQAYLKGETETIHHLLHEHAHLVPSTV